MPTNFLVFLWLRVQPILLTVLAADGDDQLPDPTPAILYVVAWLVRIAGGIAIGVICWLLLQQLRKRDFENLVVEIGGVLFIILLINKVTVFVPALVKIFAGG